MRLGRSWILGIAAVLSACGSLDPPLEEALDAGRSAEIVAWVETAQASAEPFWIMPEMEAVGPSVWRLVTEHPRGGRSVRYRWLGVEGMEWMAANVWEPRLGELRAQAEARGSEDGLHDLVELMEHNLLRTSVWQQMSHLPEEGEASRLCSPVANATAASTTAGSGAKSYANGMTCAAGYMATGHAWAWSQQAGEDGLAFSRPAGQYGSASAVRYGYPCSAYAVVDAFPIGDEDDYDCP